MAGAVRLLTGAIAVLVAALLADRFVLGPMRADRALDALPRLPLEEAIGTTASHDVLVLLDDRAGWFLIDDPDKAAGLSIGLSINPPGPEPASEQLVPDYCGDDRGHILWAVREARIVAELATCGPGMMDLRALREAAAPILLERDLLTGPEADILRAEIAEDPRRIAVTLPPEGSDLPFERAVALPWIWIGHDEAGAAVAALEAGRSALAAALAGHGGAFEIEGELRTALAPGTADPLLVLDGRPVIIDGLAVVARPVYHIRCSEAACAALDGLALGDGLGRWRDEAVLAGALASARDAGEADPSAEPPPDRADLLSDVVGLSAVDLVRHVVRVARRR